MEQRRQNLRDQLNRDHKEYNKCVTRAASWHREHNAEGVGSKFKAAMALTATSGDQAEHAAALELNECRSLCKDYWRAGREYSRLNLAQEEQQELAARHARFVKFFKPLDCLDEYCDADLLVFNPLRFADQRIIEK